MSPFDENLAVIQALLQERVSEHQRRGDNVTAQAVAQVAQNALRAVKDGYDQISERLKAVSVATDAAPTKPE